MTVILDSGPLGMATNPKFTPKNLACQQWVRDLLTNGVRVVVPKIADYEVRRELLRASKTNGLKRLDLAKSTLEYLPITTEAMLLAADLWAQARRAGYAAASDKALDGDMILTAQALTLYLPTYEMVVATSNVGHPTHFVTAQEWQDIMP